MPGTETPPAERRFKVALSYAGEHRDRVAPIARRLAEVLCWEAVLYDRFHRAEFARPNLSTYLTNLYRAQSELIVVVLCPEYTQKKWCRLEWRHIHDLIFHGEDARIMLLSVGDPADPANPDALADIGILDGDGYLDISDLTAEEVAKHIQARLRLNHPPPAAPVARPPRPPAQFGPDVDRVIQYVPERLVGRAAELEALDHAWDKALAEAPGRPRVLSLVALGGEGKTALVAKWLDGLAAEDWAQAEATFAWSFYSQGTREQASASSDAFLAAALTYLGDEETAQSARHAVDKAKALVHHLRGRRVLLILDGLEPLQYPPGSPLAGKLRDPAMATLLRGLATQSQGLCLITTRYAVQDLASRANASAVPVERLSEAAGVALLEALGVHGPKAEMAAAVRAVAGHALTLNLLGGYLRDAYDGDVRRWKQVGFPDANEAVLDGHAFRAMGAYARWFEQDELGRRAMALLRLLGLFDRPAEARLVQALLQEPVIEGLTEALVGLREVDLNQARRRLEDSRLLTVVRDGHQVVSYDAHPLIRAYFAQELREHDADAWRAGHQRVFEHLCEHTEYWPESLEGLQPLYQAVAHGCAAGLHQKARAEVYRDRILRGTGSGGFYSSRKLGAIGADLGAVANFFEAPWRSLAAGLSPGDQTWLLSEAGTRLRALGRLQEALEPMRAGLDRFVAEESWKQAAVVGGNVSELALTLGQVAAALESAERAVGYADDSEDPFLRMGARTTVADAQHQAGRLAASTAAFAQAERIQAERQPKYPWLYSVQGYRYCDLLLAPAEQAAWGRVLGAAAAASSAEVRAASPAVNKRAEQTLQWAKQNRAAILGIGLDHLSLGRASLYAALLTDDPATRRTARTQLYAAVDTLRRAGAQEFIPPGLLARALLRATDDRLTGPQSAQEDLDEAWDLAEPGPMRLHMAEIHLDRARLFFRHAPYPWQSPEEDLRAARRLIETCGYGRRAEELQQAERVILGHTRPVRSMSV